MPTKTMLLMMIAAAMLVAGCTGGVDDDEDGGPGTPAGPEESPDDEGDGILGDDEGTQDDPASGSFNVEMDDNYFEPEEAWVEVGTTVTWTNEGDVAHTATADDGSFDTGNVQPGESADATFDEAGGFAYMCTIHPEMTATITVVEAGGNNTTA